MPRKSTDPFTYAGFPSPNGTVVPDDLFDVLMPELSEAELRVLLYIIRRTFGFKKDSDAISLSQMVDGVTTRDGRVLDRGTGMSRRGVMNGCAGLLEKGIVEVERRLSEQGDNEINIYRLRFRAGQGVGNEVPYGRAPSAPGVGNEVPPQQTGLQTTDRHLSKIRTVQPIVDNLGPTGEESRPGAKRQPGGVSAIGEVLPASRLGETVAAWQHRTDGGAETAAPPPNDTSGEGNGRTPTGSLAPRRQGRPRRVYDEDREVLLAFVQDFSREFNDQAPLAASVTRAHNLLRASGLTREAFLDRLYQARAVTKERSASVRAQAGTDGAGLPTKNKMAYFFAVLEDLLGLAGDRDRPAAPN